MIQNSLENTFYEREIPLKIYYEAKDRNIVELDSDSREGIIIKLTEEVIEGKLNSLLIEVLSRKNVFWRNDY